MAGENGWGALAPEDPNAPVASYAPPAEPAPVASTMPIEPIGPPVPPPVDAGPMMSVAPPAEPVSSVAPAPGPAKPVQQMTDDEYRRAALAHAGNRSADVSIVSPATQAVVLRGATAGKERLAMGAKAQALQAKKNDVVEEAGFKNMMTDIVQAEQEEALWKKEALKQQYAADQYEDEKIRRSNELRAQQEDIDRTSRELAKFEIDPERKQKSRSFGERFANGIAAAMLGFGSGAAGVQTVMNRIQSENEADIQAQKDQYAAKQMGLKGKETIYEKMLQRYGTEDAATAATRAAGLEQAKLQAQAWAAKAKGPEAQKAFNTLVGNVEAHRFEELQRNMKVMGATPAKVAWRMPNGDMVTGTAEQFNQYKLAKGIKDEDASRSTGSAVVVKGAEGKAKAEEDARKAEKDERERFVATGPDGQGYLAPTTDEAKRARGQRESIAEMRGTINEIKKLREGISYKDRLAAAGGIQTEAVKRLNSLGSSLLMATNKGAGLGALDNGSVAVLKDRLGDIASMDPRKDPIPQLEAVLGEADRTLNVAASGASGYTQTAPKGEQGW